MTRIRTPQQEQLAETIAAALLGQTPAPAEDAPLSLTDDDRAMLRQIEADAGLRSRN